MLGNRWYRHFLFRLLLFIVVIAIAMQFFFGHPTTAESQRATFVEEFNKIQTVFQEGDFDGLGEEIQQKENPLASIAYQINLAKFYANEQSARNQKSDQLFNQAIEASKTLQDSGLLVFALAQRGHYYYRMRKISLAMPDMVEVVFLLERYPNIQPPFEQKVYKQVGFFLGTIGDFEKANKFLHRSLALTEPTDTHERAALLDNIGFYALQSKDTSGASHYFDQAQSLAKQSRDTIRQAKIWGNRALIAWSKGERKQALEFLRKDIAISDDKGDSLNTLYATNILSTFLLEEGEVTEAKYYLRRIQPFAEKHRNLIVHRHTLHQLFLKIALAESNEEVEFNQRRLLYSMQDSLNLFDGENVTKQTRWQAEREMIAERLAQSNHEYALEKKKNSVLMGLAVSVVLLLGGVYGTTYRKARKEKRAFQQQMRQIEIDANQQAKQLQMNQTSSIAYATDNDSVQRAGRDKLQQLLSSSLITDESWRTFKRTFSNIYPDSYHELMSKFPELSESNLRIALLQKLDLSNNEISDLLGVTPGAIKKSKQRLHKKMGEERYVLFQDEMNKPLL
ncbi:hypothetical protein FXV77_00435 [Sphingobacterium phlebotomi]|uniref:Uncharacterized protein n=1 Tax=Sphingobacterium phlebotomi TaxID=2605433 RepID=A0A5D4HC79_9SPHI|nr:hypothetical protein [Sphingobacterium phlebotomi]TYR37793.1 hypothetical protein FXV77_00435 [Sphingobacterium phlebotomi]